MYVIPSRNYRLNYPSRYGGGGSGGGGGGGGLFIIRGYEGSILSSVNSKRRRRLEDEL